ncbi:uncharacterized protein LOC131939388 [Physella acuta]|uniref:uncharacterized protein LOC131939388 n=1 Tax=Physella acuta TaxID=109671 RepID=UPI0027DC38C7|nr:uncharacterized protein LOC131939388 [Physella acuta]
MWYMHIFLAMSFIQGNSLAQKITISDYNPTYSKTECTTGFISWKDYVVYNVAVDAGSVGLENKTVRFHTARYSSDQWHHLCLVNLDHKCSLSQTAVCYCNQSEGTLFQVVINMTASSKYSGGLLKGYVGVDIVSNVQKIPQMYDLSEVMFDVNGFNFTGDSNALQLQTNESTITFCCRDLPSPCRAKIKHQQELVASGEPCAVYNISSTHQQGSFNLTLAYDICKVTKEINVLIHYGLSQSNQEYFVLIMSLITTIVVMSLLLMASICYIQSINRKQSIVQG